MTFAATAEEQLKLFYSHVKRNIRAQYHVLRVRKQRERSLKVINRYARNSTKDLRSLH